MAVVVSVNVGLPRRVAWRERTVGTGIFKEPVAGRIRVRRHNLDGDEQADRSVHGGPEKAVYAYPAEHYAAWQEELGPLAWGAFGENLTVAGLAEDDVRVGDRLRIGSAELMVTQPRLPCYKLGVRLGQPDVVKRFLASRRTGFYLAVLREGELEAGDAITLVSRDAGSITIAEVTRLYVGADTDRARLEGAMRNPALPAGWRAHFAERLGRGR